MHNSNVNTGRLIKKIKHNVTKKQKIYLKLITLANKHENWERRKQRK